MNHSQPGPTKAIVFTYFARQATPLERQAIEAWLETDEGNMLYYTYLDEWERLHPQFYPDIDAARHHFAQFMRQSVSVGSTELGRHEVYFNSISTHKPTHWLQSRGFLWMAASVALLISIWITTDHWYYTTQSNGYKQIQSLTLPDGSGVLLGANSSVKYARFGFSRGTRRVWLDGEAEFRIVHQPNRQRFMVETPDKTTVEVLGTVFVINSRRNNTRIVLESGRIELNTPHTVRPVVLAPGDMVTVSDQGHLKMQHPSITPSRVTWHDHRFVFADTPLADVANQLHDIFGVTVKIPQSDLMARNVSGTFQADTADDLLQALKLMMNLHIDQSKAVYVLTQ
jgi:transmembrane sensor